MLPSKWESAVIAANGTISAEVDLGRDYEFLTVIIPTLGDTATTTVHISDASAGTFVPMYYPDMDATGDFAHATSDATTTHAITFRIGGVRYIKIVTGATQTAETTFKVKGFNRE